MSTPTAAMAATLPAKRKRAQVSYVEEEDDMFDSGYETDGDTLIDNSGDGLPEGDSVYGSRKKLNRTKGRKKLRFTRPRPKKPSKPFPFLSLPAELRDQIYELALTEDSGISLVSKTKAFRRTIARGIIYNDDYYQRVQNPPVGENEKAVEPTYNRLVPNLLTTNKQIYAEGLGYLYKQAVVVEDTMALHTFLTAIGPTNRSQLSNITVKSWGTGRGTHKAMNVAAFSMLAGCTNLKVLNFDCRIGWLRQPIWLARQLYRDGHYFFEAYGAAKGQRDAAVEVLQLDSWNFDRDNWFGWRRSADTLPEKKQFKEDFQKELQRLLGA